MGTTADPGPAAWPDAVRRCAGGLVLGGACGAKGTRAPASTEPEATVREADEAADGRGRVLALTALAMRSPTEPVSLAAPPASLKSSSLSESPAAPCWPRRPHPPPPRAASPPLPPSSLSLSSPPCIRLSTPSACCRARREGDLDSPPLPEREPLPLDAPLRPRLRLRPDAPERSLGSFIVASPGRGDSASSAPPFAAVAGPSTDCLRLRTSRFTVLARLTAARATSSVTCTRLAAATPLARTPSKSSSSESSRPSACASRSDASVSRARSRAPVDLEPDAALRNRAVDSSNTRCVARSCAWAPAQARRAAAALGARSLALAAEASLSAAVACARAASRSLRAARRSAWSPATDTSAALSSLSDVTSRSPSRRIRVESSAAASSASRSRAESSAQARSCAAAASDPDSNEAAASPAQRYAGRTAST
mmetsp:Transcript_16724/g.63314  ORF Transcript_16724/g.63314 Transcript_16724/m.63314 type:complete len:426 (-) Transcript_16724:983-2260(-)